ncbi:uracil-DNA glycosylase [Halobacterium litoreum]|uniref:Uracil-DNA glycosylase family protein n=1 Tax=Halobacterium litoreum TaxID=2039234 RepID=A0ABD5NBL8_9EURY|nr:uracil-DNA glycosylase family protein [Halobacterium litoreum]UHH14426.1 uracil-DNA glycosylase family protein [Halobacterium litoreum]
MDAEQDAQQNPYGMDEDCRNCPGLCDERERVVHGYGDVGADFVFVGEAPSAGAERTGVPFTGGDADERFQHVLGSVGLNYSLPDSEEPELENAFLTYLTRCRHPDREPTDDEVVTCEPYLNADVRMINPEILVPVGQRALTELGKEYTTTPAGDLNVAERHATAIRGRGFELVPMVAPENLTDERADEWVEFFLDLQDTDYRQTKGRRKR